MPVETLIAPTPIAAASVPQQQRYHSFDSLRAAMMFLGIWMHGVQCYTYLEVYMGPFKDTARSQVFDFTINWVHQRKSARADEPGAQLQFQSNS